MQLEEANGPRKLGIIAESMSDIWYFPLFYNETFRFVHDNENEIIISFFSFN